MPASSQTVGSSNRENWRQTDRRVSSHLDDYLRGEQVGDTVLHPPQCDRSDEEDDEDEVREQRCNLRREFSCFDVNTTLEGLT